MSQLPNNINPLKASLNTGKAHKASKPAKRNIDLGKHLSKLDPRKIPFGALKRVPRGYRIASLLTVAVALSLPVANKHLDLDSHTPAPSTAAPAEAPAKISEEKKVSAKPENKPQEESDINAQIEALKAQLAQQQEETLKLQSLLKEQQTGTNEQKTPENMTVDEAAAYGMNNIENVAQELENQGIDTSALQGMREMMANGNPLETNSNIINNAKNFNQQFVERAQGMTTVEQMEFIQKHFGHLTPAEVQQGLADGSLNQRLQEAMAGKSVQQLQDKNAKVENKPEPPTKQYAPGVVYPIPQGLKVAMQNDSKTIAYDNAQLTQTERNTLNGYSPSIRTKVMGVVELTHHDYIRMGGQTSVDLSKSNINRLGESLFALKTQAGTNLMNANKKSNPQKMDKALDSLLNSKTMTAETLAIALRLADVPDEYNAQITGLSEKYVVARTDAWCAQNNFKSPQTLWNKFKRTGGKLREKTGDVIEKTGSTIKDATSMTQNPKVQEHIKDLMGKGKEGPDTSAMV